MNYKFLILSILLMPLTAMSSDIVDQRIQELKNTQTEKQEELSNLNDMIDKQEDLIDSLCKKERALLVLIYETSEDEEAEEFKQTLRAFSNSLKEANKDIKAAKDFLINKSINNDEDEDEMTRLKTWLIRYRMLYQTLRKLLKSHEECLIALFEIEIELEDLSRQI